MKLWLTTFLLEHAYTVHEQNCVIICGVSRGVLMQGASAPPVQLNRGGSSLVRQGSHEPPVLSATTHPLESPGSVEGTKLLHTVKSNIYLLLNGCDQPKVGVASAKNFACFARALLLNPPFQFPGSAPG